MKATEKQCESTGQFFIRGERMYVSSSRHDSKGRALWDVNSRDGTLWGTGYSREQAILRARRNFK